VAYNNGYNVLLTGHNLDDETARLLGNLLNWDEEYIYRQYPVLPAEGRMVKKVKPLVFVSRNELIAYCEAEGIEYIKIGCPNSKGARSLFLTNVIDSIEEKYPATKLRFLRGFFKIRNYFHPHETVKLYECPACGMLTTSEKLCRFCRIKNRIGNGSAKAN